jgi:hypothetical protein
VDAALIRGETTLKSHRGGYFEGIPCDVLHRGRIVIRLLRSVLNAIEQGGK